MNKLYFQYDLKKAQIIEKERVSKPFVTKWTESPDQDVSIDKRGWIKGRRRKWCEMTETRIQELHKQLVEEPTEFFSGATAVQHCWRLKYPDNPPPLRTIGQIMKDLNLTSRKQKDSRKGAARYLCYPEKTVYGGRLGSRVMEADFIVRRYLKGSSIPLHFVGFSAKKSPRLRYFMRVHALTADAFIDACDRFFDRFEVPQTLKLDNAATFIGSLSGKRTLSQTMIYLLPEASLRDK